MANADIWGTTRKLIELYGPSAVETAEQRAVRLKAQGDSDGFARWREISCAARQLIERHARDGRQLSPNGT